MIRSCLVLFTFVAALIPAFAAEQPERLPYLVATRHPSSQLQLALSRGVAVKHFKSVNGFAAKLTAEEVSELQRSRDVLFIEPDLERYALEFGPGDDSTSAAASTQRLPYGIEMVQAPPVWPRARGRGIRVGVIDTGTKSDHPDLTANYRGGYDFVHNDNDPEDDSGHGTHVVGTIAAVDNELGVIGVAPEAEIYSLKVLAGPRGRGNVSDVIRAVDWAIENDMHIISLSLGSLRPSVLEEEAFARAFDAGLVAVAAAGNGYSGFDGLVYPAGYPTVLSVGAIDIQQEIATFSQRGPDLKLVAPGVGVLSSKIIGLEVVVDEGGYLEVTELEGSPRADVSGPLVFAGLGHPEQFPPTTRGAIALMQRGELLFREKVRNALSAGAVAAVIYNSAPGGFRGTLIRDSSGQIIPEEKDFPWPVTLGISGADGERIRAFEGRQFTVRSSAGGYGPLSGTSMATPHVSGVAALIWSAAPYATADQVRRAMLAATTDLGEAGFDNTFGHGLVNAARSERRLRLEAGEREPKPRPIIEN